jgi:cytochrome c oxidase subunit IV
VSTKAHDSKHEDHGMGRYIAVFAVLLVLTGVTVWTGEMDFGGWNIIIAMVVATIKASLVVLFFMHLWDEGPFNRLIFVVSVLFALVLILFVFGDLMFRIPGLLPPSIQQNDIPKILESHHHH